MQRAGGGSLLLMEKYADEFTCEQQEDGQWFILRYGQFFCACSTESTAKEIMEYLRRDAEEHEQKDHPL